CQSVYRQCLKRCEYKSSQSNLLDNSAQLSCRLFCNDGKRACDNGDKTKAKYRMCAGMCAGLTDTKESSFSVFGTTDYDECKNRCFDELVL
ncbi:MAG: hypothetical protein L3J47_04610, partial [Sulfurovum sp.]|nr:hypothetical protein [Sulfurovum sp.]